MFKIVRQQGVSTPTFVSVFASGTIRRGSVVDMTRSTNTVSPSSSNSTYTMIFGVSLDFVEGASDTKVRIVPFVPGQLWSADCSNITATNQLMIRHSLTDFVSLNNTSTDVKTSKGVFMAYGIYHTVYLSFSSASMQILGEFNRQPSGWDGTG